MLPTKDALTGRLQTARAERADLSREYRKITRRIADAQREAAIRDRLDPDVTAYGDDARARALRGRRTAVLPAWDDREARPLGRVVALRDRQAATRNELAELSRERNETIGNRAGGHSHNRMAGRCWYAPGSGHYGTWWHPPRNHSVPTPARRIRRGD